MKMRGWVWLNGRIVAAERARISVFDRGLQYGDGLFETLRIYGGRVFALREHLARMRASAAFLSLPLPAPSWERVIARLLTRNGLADGDGWVRITLTRGPSERGLLPAADCRPTLLLTCGHLDPGLAGLQRRGIAVALLPFARNPPLAAHKTGNYMEGVLGKMIAAKRRCYDGVFVAGDGSIREATTANLFVIKGERLLTPAANDILAGITRAAVMDLAGAQGWRVAERRIDLAVLREADEIFLSSSVAEIVPVISVDGQRVRDGRVGARTRLMQRLYHASAVGRSR